MKRIINRLKPVFLLISMTLVCVCIVWVTNQLKNINAYSSSKIVANETVISNEETEMETIAAVQDTSVPLEVEESNIEEVLAASSSSFSCNRNADEFTEIKSESICEKKYEDGELNFGESNPKASKVTGTTVKLDAKVTLTEVYVPLELFSGVEVADSNRLIKSETPTLKPAGEQIDDLTANSLLPPNEQIDTYKSWDEEEPFATDYSVGFDKGKTQEGDIGVENKLENKCEYCNNKANPNPDGSNKASEFLRGSNYHYPNQQEQTEDSQIIESCSSSDTFTDWEDRYAACKLNIVEQIIEFFRNIPGWGTIVENTKYCTKYPDECIDTADIIVIMESPFGSDIGCKEGSACTNAYMQSRNGAASAPDADLGVKHYYLTPCKAFIEGASGEQEIKCAWDMSHLFKERKVNEFDDMPSIDTTPTDEEYQEFLLQKVQGTRGVAVPM